MFELNAAPSSFFGRAAEEEPSAVHSNERWNISNTSSSFADSEAQYDAARREWLRQHGGFIYPSRCQQSHCGCRRPVIDNAFLEQGDVCTTCGYPKTHTDTPIVLCLCLCRCEEDFAPTDSDTDPISILDWCVARYDVADEEYDPDDHSSVSDNDSHIGDAVPLAELLPAHAGFETPAFWMTDLVVGGFYTRKHMLEAFGQEAHDIFHPRWTETDEDGRIRCFRHPPQYFYNLQPARCRYCGLTIADYRDVCETCMRPLSANDETTSIGVGTSLLFGQDCLCQCTCDNANIYQSSLTSQQESGHPPRSPEQQSNHGSMSDEGHTDANSDASTEYDVERVNRHHTVFPSPSARAQSLRILRSGQVYSPVASPNVSPLSLGSSIYDGHDFMSI